MKLRNNCSKSKIDYKVQKNAKTYFCVRLRNFTSCNVEALRNLMLTREKANPKLNRTFPFEDISRKWKKRIKTLEKFCLLTVL